MNWVDRWIMQQPKRIPVTEHRPDPRAVPWKYNTFVPRFWASLIDDLILALLFGVMAIIALSLDFPVKITRLGYVAYGLIHLSYRIILHGCFGQTLGKMAAKVKVLALDETPLGMRRAFLRNSVDVVLALVNWFIAVPMMLKSGSLGGLHQVPHGDAYFLFVYSSQAWLLVELLTFFASTRRRAAHDFIAGSVVVRVQALELEQGKHPVLRRPGAPTHALSPVTAKVLAVLLVLGFAGIKLFGGGNAAMISFFPEMYSDRQLAGNLHDGDFTGPARRSFSILAKRKSPLGEAKARALLSDETEWLQGALYLAALGQKDSIPYLIRALEEGDAKRLRVIGRRQIIDRLKNLTGRDFGEDVGSWKSWWNTQNPSMPPESAPAEKDSPPSTGPTS